MREIIAPTLRLATSQSCEQGKAAGQTLEISSALALDIRTEDIELLGEMRE